MFGHAIVDPFYKQFQFSNLSLFGLEFGCHGVVVYRVCRRFNDYGDFVFKYEITFCGIGGCRPIF